MLKVKDEKLGEEIIFTCQNFKPSKGSCRSGAPREGIKKGEVCPFDTEQHLCMHFVK